MIYFVQEVMTRRIKIGFTRSRGRRLQELQVFNSGDLKFLGGTRGSRRAERALHRRFAHLHHHGEWFEPGEDLLAFIREASVACAPAPESRGSSALTALPREPYGINHREAKAAVPSEACEGLPAVSGPESGAVAKHPLNALARLLLALAAERRRAREESAVREQEGGGLTVGGKWVQ